MKKRIVLLIAMFYLIVIGIIVINAQSPTPSLTSSPTPSVSPLPTSSLSPCSGEANMSIEIERQKTFGEEDTFESLTNNIRSMVNELINYPNLEDFQKCTYPSTFSCPEDYCNVTWEIQARSGLSPSTSSTTSTSEDSFVLKTIRGITAINLGPGDLALIGIGSVFNKEAIINYVMPILMEELQKVVDEIIKNTPNCPEGYGRYVSVSLGQPDVKITYIPFTNIPFSIKASLPYTVTIYCKKLSQDKDSIESADLELKVFMKKKCVKGPAITIFTP